MATITKASQNTTVNGLGSFTYTIQTAGVHTGGVRALVNAPSSVSITIAQSGSVTDSTTSSAPTPNQREIDLKKTFNCAVNDVLTFTISSSSASDQQLNNSVKTTIQITQGESA